MNRPVPVSDRGRYLGNLMVERNWEDMSLYELELLRGIIEVCHDPEYLKVAQKKREERKQQQRMEEKPFQFNIMEYVEKTKKPEITEVFIQEFYRLSQEDQSRVMDTLGRYHRSSMNLRANEIMDPQEFLRAKRIDAFLDQWIEEQTKGWVAREIRKIPEDPRRYQKKVSKNSMTQTDTTILEGHVESFLEMLYRHQEQQRIPVVNEDFLQRLSSLGEEEQYKAMEHISRLTGCDGVGLRGEVYRERLKELYKAWYEDQTEEWVNLYFRPPVERQYWERETERRKAQHDGEEPQVGEESAYEDMVIAAYAGYQEGTQETISLGEAKKELGL